MRRTAALLSLVLLAAPAQAQEDDEGFNLMEEGARLFFRGLMSEMEPTLDEMERTLREMQPLMQDFLAEMGPAMGDILDQVDDWTQYEPPVLLENGDILIRRKTVPPSAPKPGEIDL